MPSPSTFSITWVPDWIKCSTFSITWVPDWIKCSSLRREWVQWIHSTGWTYCRHQGWKPFQCLHQAPSRGSSNSYCSWAPGCHQLWSAQNFRETSWASGSRGSGYSELQGGPGAEQQGGVGAASCWEADRDQGPPWSRWEERRRREGKTTEGSTAVNLEIKGRIHAVEWLGWEPSTTLCSRWVQAVARWERGRSLDVHLSSKCQGSEVTFSFLPLGQALLLWLPPPFYSSLMWSILQT